MDINVLESRGPFILPTKENNTRTRSYINYLCNNLERFDAGSSADDIRHTIFTVRSYTMTTKEPVIVYVLNFTEISTIAKGALLKALEEDNNILYILSTDNISDVDDVFLTRCKVATTYENSTTEIAFLVDNVNTDNRYSQLLKDTCNSLSDVDEVMNNGASSYINDVTMIFKNIRKVNEANALKLVSKFKTKVSDINGYNIELVSKILCFIAKKAVLANEISCSEYLTILNARKNLDINIYRNVPKLVAISEYILYLRK